MPLDISSFIDSKEVKAAMEEQKKHKPAPKQPANAGFGSGEAWNKYLVDSTENLLRLPVGERVALLFLPAVFPSVQASVPEAEKQWGIKAEPLNETIRGVLVDTAAYHGAQPGQRALFNCDDLPTPLIMLETYGADTSKKYSFAHQFNSPNTRYPGVWPQHEEIRNPFAAYRTARANAKPANMEWIDFLKHEDMMPFLAKTYAYAQVIMLRKRASDSEPPEVSLALFPIPMSQNGYNVAGKGPLAHLRNLFKDMSSPSKNIGDRIFTLSDLKEPALFFLKKVQKTDEKLSSDDKRAANRRNTSYEELALCKYNSDDAEYHLKSLGFTPKEVYNIFVETGLKHVCQRPTHTRIRMPDADEMLNIFNDAYGEHNPYIDSVTEEVIDPHCHFVLNEDQLFAKAPGWKKMKPTGGMDLEGRANPTTPASQANTAPVTEETDFSGTQPQEEAPTETKAQEAVNEELNTAGLLLSLLLSDNELERDSAGGLIEGAIEEAAEEDKAALKENLSVESLKALAASPSDDLLELEPELASNILDTVQSLRS